MAKKHIVDTGRWSFPSIRKLSATAKCVFEYLISNPLTSKSGIYRIYSGAIMDGIGHQILPDVAKVNEIINQLRNEDLIDYDGDCHLIYIKNFHKYVPFGSGRSDIMAKVLLAEMKEYEHPIFWEKYKTENSQMINDFFNDAIKYSKKPETITSNTSVTKLKKFFLIDSKTTQ